MALRKIKTVVRYRCGRCHDIIEHKLVDYPNGKAPPPPDVCGVCGNGGPNPLNKRGVWAKGGTWRGRKDEYDTSRSPPYYPYDFAEIDVPETKGNSPNA